MDIGKCFRDAWGLFKLDLGPLVTTALVAAVIVGIVNLIVGSAAYGDTTFNAFAFLTGFGLARALGGFVIFVVSLVVYSWAFAVLFRIMIRRIREGRAADFADLADTDQIGVFAVGTIVLGVIIGIGYALLIIPGLILTTIWVYALPLIADRRLGVGEAMSESKDMAARPDYFTTFGAWVVGAVVVFVVVALLGRIPVIGFIGGLLAMPFGVGYLLSMYFQARGQGHLVDIAVGAATRTDAPPPRGQGG